MASGPFDLIVCGTLTNLFDLPRVRELIVAAKAGLASGGRIVIATSLRDHGPVGEHPPHVSEKLGVRVNVAADRTLDLAIGRIRAYRARLRRDPDRWDAALVNGIRETGEFVESGGDPLHATHSGDDAA